jgi:hypothetical protein
LAIRLTPGLAAGQDALIMVRPEKALALTAEQAAREPLPAGWNEVAATVGEVLFGEPDLPCGDRRDGADGQGAVGSGDADAGGG